VFVVDGADELFEQVLQGDEASDAAILVEYDGDLGPL
jgi:hypothetical protein